MAKAAWRLNEEEVNKIKADGRSASVIATEFRVAKSTINRIRSGKTHRSNKEIVKPEVCLPHKIIRSILADERKTSEVAKSFGVTPRYVDYIKTRARRKSVKMVITDKVAVAIFTDNRTRAAVAQAYYVSESTVDKIRRRKLKAKATVGLVLGGAVLPPPKVLPDRFYRPQWDEAA